MTETQWPQQVMFQSAPCTRVQGDLAPKIPIDTRLHGFNPLPAPEYREMGIVLLPPPSDRTFQSAPCTRVQGDKAAAEIAAREEQFQSAPCTRVQGDRNGNALRFYLKVVSIRSLHQSTGRSPTLAQLHCPPPPFQSAPCTRVQGDPLSTPR